MNTEDIFKLITSKPKWYAGMKCRTGEFHTAQSANRIKNRFKQGRLPEETIENIFNHFNFYKNEVTWIKK